MQQLLVVVVVVVVGGSLREHVWKGVSAEATEEEEDEEGIDGQCGEKEEEKSAGDELRRTRASVRSGDVHGRGVWGCGY